MMARYAGSGLIAAAARKNERLAPIGDGMRFKNEDEVYFFVLETEADAAAGFLSQEGWRCLARIDKDLFTTSSCRLDPGNG